MNLLKIAPAVAAVAVFSLPQAALATWCPPKITEVVVNQTDTGGTLEIYGKCFPHDPEVLFAEYQDGSLTELVINSNSTNMVEAELYGPIDPGDYLVKLQSDRFYRYLNDEWQLTVGAVGPEGPEGPAGAPGQSTMKFYYTDSHGDPDTR